MDNPGVFRPNLQFTRPLVPLVFNNVRHIIFHHIAGQNATAEDIHRWHLNQGWKGGGYNEYIRFDGSVHIMRGDNVGAQTAGYNSSSYGIGCEGNFQNLREMPPAQFAACVGRAVYHLSRFPNSTLANHGMKNRTLCPGQHFPWAQLVQAVEKRMSAPSIIVPAAPPQPHWAESHRQNLINRGILVHEGRYDDPISRGETFALLDRALPAQVKLNN